MRLSENSSIVLLSGDSFIQGCYCRPGYMLDPETDECIHESSPNASEEILLKFPRNIIKNIFKNTAKRTSI